jgi:integrase/recombinase XerD
MSNKPDESDQPEEPKKLAKSEQPEEPKKPKRPKGYEFGKTLSHRSKEKRGGLEKEWEPQGEPGTLEGELRRYITSMEVRNYAKGSIDGARYRIRPFIEWANERDLSKPEEITLSLLESFQRHLHRHRKSSNGKPLTANTQRGYISVLKLYFAWMTKQKTITANPASELELPRPEKHLQQEALSHNQVRQLLNLPDLADPLGLRDRVILETFYSTGIRRSELTTLEITDLNYERQTLRIRQGKGKKDRTVPLGKNTLVWLTRYLEEARPKLSLHESRSLFLSVYGDPFNPDTLSQMVSRWIRKVEIGRPGSCHLLRHTCATHMLENGADIRYIQQLLGHEKLDTTALYTQGSIIKLKQVHARTHPSELPKDHKNTSDDQNDPVS